MADEPEVLDDEQLETEEPAPQAPEEESASLREARARRQGWRPRDEWRGPATDWVGYDEFLDRANTYLPIVQKRLRDTEAELRRTGQEVTSLKETVAEQTQSLRELVTMAKTANQQGYDRAMRELKQRQREAASAGDMDTFDKVGERIDEIEEERRVSAAPAPKPNGRDAAAEPAPQPRPQVTVAPEVEAFVEENPWFRTDRVLNAAMQEEHTRLLKESPGLSLAENLERAKEALMAQFPRKFGIEPQAADAPRRPRRGAVQEPTAPLDQRPKPGAIDSIQDPEERKRARTEYERQKKFVPGFTEADYMNLYLNPHAEGTDFISGSKKERRANG